MSSDTRRKVREVSIDAADGILAGWLSVPRDPKGLVIFAHGSGSGKESSRNGRVAELLFAEGFASLLFDLLTGEEKMDYRANVFDMGLLTRRLDAAVEWAVRRPELAGLPIGLNGGSTGAGAALNVAASRGDQIAAVVSRGGRPDLADQEDLAKVTAPTLLIVGGDDTEVILMNKSAAKRLKAKHELVLVPDATHVFDEPGTFEQAAALTVDWFKRHLKRQ